MKILDNNKLKRLFNFNKIKLRFIKDKRKSVSASFFSTDLRAPG